MVFLNLAVSLNLRTVLRRTLRELMNELLLVILILIENSKVSSFPHLWAGMGSLMRLH